MPQISKKKSLVGYTYKGYDLKMCAAQARIPSIFPKAEYVYHDMAYRPSVKVRITIEEITK